MYSSVNSLLKRISYIPDWKTKDHIVVFESDDWGSLRMPSISSFKKLERLGIDLRSEDAERYNLNDSLESSNDLEGLFEILSSVKDKNGNYAVFTPITIVANPNFMKIKKSGFREYFYEPFTETFKRFAGCENSFKLWMEGIKERLFLPQMHGREHLNVLSWINALRTGDKQTLHAFQEGMWGFVPTTFPKVDYQAAFLLGNINELQYQKNVITEGLRLFNTIFNYKAEYFVPPNGIINNSLNEVLAKNGIKYRYVARIQNETMGNNRSRKVIHWLGQRHRTGVIYMIRNCFFEPSMIGKDWVDSCLKDIELAFNMNQPAIIGSHRVNYIGSINQSNRNKNLKQLHKLLNSVIKQWPNTTFLTTAELGKCINA